MQTVYLLRHCEYKSVVPILPGRLPVELSRDGVVKAKKLQQYFKFKNISKIYSSAVLRCKQTSEIISDGNIPIQYDKRLLEILSAYQGYWKPNWCGNSYHFHSHIDELGGESINDLYDRITDFWNEIVNESIRNYIICSHGDILVMLYAYIKHLPMPDLRNYEETIPGWLSFGEYHEIIINESKTR